MSRNDVAGHDSDPWLLGDPYERYVGRWSRKVAPPFLDWLRILPGRRWVDVGCGTGALCAAILERCEPGHVVGVEPSEGFLATARASLPAEVSLRRGTATDTGLEDASVDIAVSALVLNFVADPAAALAELRRVVRPGGTIGAYVWDYAAKMELIRYFWDAAALLDPAAAALDEGVRFPLCRPEPLTDLFTRAGLRGVEVAPIDVLTRFESFEDYWSPFLGAQGPAPAYAASLGPEAQGRLRDRLRSLLPSGRDGSVELIARAWAVRGNS
jgi:SAM-dependent methyltransferase